MVYTHVKSFTNELLSVVRDGFIVENLGIFSIEFSALSCISFSLAACCCFHVICMHSYFLHSVLIGFIVFQLTVISSH